MVYARTCLLMVLLGSLIALFPTYTNAGWCGCGNCWMMHAYPGYCTCGPPYYWCFDDPDASGLNKAAYTGMASKGTVIDISASFIANSDMTKEVMRMGGGQCLRDRLTLSLLGSARTTVKIAPVYLDEDHFLRSSKDTQKRT